MEPFETIEHRHHTIKLYQDEMQDEGPRDWDNLAEMTAYHPHYILGDQKDRDKDDLIALVEREDVYSLPLYLYDHSGLWMGTSRGGWPFSCPWDTSHVGYIWVTKEQVRQEYGVKRISAKLRDKVFELMRGEVSVYNQFISGEVYGFVIEDENGDHVDSCWGFYGDPAESIVPEAMSFIDSITKEQVGLIY